MLLRCCAVVVCVCVWAVVRTLPGQKALHQWPTDATDCFVPIGESKGAPPPSHRRRKAQRVKAIKNYRPPVNRPALGVSSLSKTHVHTSLSLSVITQVIYLLNKEPIALVFQVNVQCAKQWKTTLLLQ